MPECHTCDLVINHDCFMCAVCVVVGAASYAALFTLSSGAHTFLDLVSLVFEEKKKLHLLSNSSIAYHWHVIFLYHS